MYFLAIVLPPGLNEKVLVHKHFMHANYRCSVGLRSPAHITIVPPFWMDEANEKLLLDDVKSISCSITPFLIETNDFSAFKPRTIFIDVKPNRQLEELKQLSDQLFENNSTYNVKIDKRPSHFHITIATRDLHKKVFYEAWEHFANKHFREAWTAKGLSILKHNRIRWDVVHTALFRERLNS